MNRSRYRNKFLKDKSQTNRENYKIQWYICKKLLRKTKKSYFENLNTKKLRIIEPSGELLFLFLQERSKGEIILNEAEKHFWWKKICRNFNKLFSNVVSNFKIPGYWNFFHKKTHVLSAIIEAFEKHPSILNIKKRKLDSVFSFRKTTKKEVLKVILDLNTKKSCQTSDTPTKIIKLNFDVFAYLIRKHFN